MDNTNSQPYHTFIKLEIGTNGRLYDACYFVSAGKEILLTPTEYALLQSSSEEGFDLEKAAAEREAIRVKYRVEEVITNETANGIFCRLRKKLNVHFPDLIIPDGHGSSSSHRRVVTRAAFEDSRKKIAHPQKCTYVDCDGSGWNHLFVDGSQVCTRKTSGGSIGNTDLALFSIGLFGNPCYINPSDPSFRKIWHKLTKKQILSPNSLRVHLSWLRRALEPVGLTITRMPRSIEPGGCGAHLLPCKPAPKPG